MDCDKDQSVVQCAFQFINNANEDLYLLKRNTPLEGLRSEFITVSVAFGRSLLYEGPIIYRLPPTKDEFVLLKAGESISASVQITDVFSIKKDGIYTVRYSGPIQYLSVQEMEISEEHIRESQIRDEQIRVKQIRDEQIRNQQIGDEQIRDEQIRNEQIRNEQIRDEQIGDEQIRELQIRMEQIRESNVHKSIEINLDDTINLVKPESQEQVKSESERVHFESCSTTTISGTPNQNAETLKAHQRLCGQIAKAKGKVGNNALYRTWFGVYSGSRPGKVRSVYQKCGDGLKDNNTIYYNHGSLCKSNYIAYTYKNGVKVYFCPYYFKQPTFCNGNAYTKEATLIHEWAHAFGLTDDVTYGATNCMNLAKSSPDKAIKNADSYRFHYCNAY